MVCGKVHHKDCGVLELKVIQVSSSQHENFEDLLLSSSSHLNGQLTSVGQFLTKHASILGREPYFWLLFWEGNHILASMLGSAQCSKAIK